MGRVLDGIGQGDGFAGPLRGVVEQDGLGRGGDGVGRVLEHERDGEVVHCFFPLGTRSNWLVS